MKHDLPIVLGAGVFDSRDRFTGIVKTAPRKLDTYELECFADEGGIATVNGKEYPIKKGAVLFAKPGDVRYSHLPFCCKFLHFNLTDKALIQGVEKIPPFVFLSEPNRAEALFCEILSLMYSTDPIDHIAAGAKLILLLHLLCNEKTDDSGVIALAKAYMQQNYKDNISVGAVAETCNISPAYLHKIFKSTLGITPGEYLQDLRISTAKKFLMNTDAPIIEIAFRCGFNSQSYFSDCFKRAVGESPKDFRRNRKER